MAEPIEGEQEEKPPPSRAKRITYLVLHVLLHIIFISYFTAATIIFIFYGKLPL